MDDQEITPIQELSNAIAKYVATIGEDLTGILSDWFVAYGKQIIHENGEVLYTRSYASSENIFAAIGVLNLAKMDAMSDMANDPDEEE